ncbi:MAG: AAA family ATPase [Bryobacteraceae bacterium]
MVLVGLPASGKSSWAQTRGVDPLSSDAIRQTLADDATDQSIHARVFATLRYLIRHRLAIGRHVTYVDATHLTREERAPYKKIADAYGCDLEAIYFDTPLDECLKRNQARERVVPEEAIRAMAAKLVAPSAEEGFHKVTVIR